MKNEAAEIAVNGAAAVVADLIVDAFNTTIGSKRPKLRAVPRGTVAAVDHAAAVLDAMNGYATAAGTLDAAIAAAGKTDIELALCQFTAEAAAMDALPRKEGSKGKHAAYACFAQSGVKYDRATEDAFAAISAAVMRYRRRFNLNPKLQCVDTDAGPTATVKPEAIEARAPKAPKADKPTEAPKADKSAAAGEPITAANVGDKLPGAFKLAKTTDVVKSLVDHIAQLDPMKREALLVQLMTGLNSKGIKLPELVEQTTATASRKASK